MTEGARVAKKGWWEVDGLDVVWKSALAALVAAVAVVVGSGVAVVWGLVFVVLTACAAGALQYGLTSTKKARAKRAALERWDAAVAKAERDAWGDELVSRAVDEALAAGIPTVEPEGDGPRLSAMRIRPPAEVPKYGEGGQVSAALASFVALALTFGMVVCCGAWFGLAGLVAGTCVALFGFCAGAGVTEVGYRAGPVEVEIVRSKS